MSTMRYSEMKDSGVDWIGEIPKNWKTLRLKFVTQCQDGKRIPVDAGQRKKGPYPYWGAGAIMDYVNDFIFDDDLVLLGEDGAPFFDLTRNVAHHVSGKIWVNNHIHVLKPKTNINASFLTHYLNVTNYRSYINGSILNKLTQSNMNKIMVVLPSLTEQEVIAAYLDEKCAAINEIIQQAKATIEEYKEWKASVIFEAVTKGLDPDAEMKDSGVEWIGEIPKHWSCIPMKYLLNERNQKNDPIVTSERLSLSIDIGVTLYAEKTTNLDRFKEDVSQYKVAHEGDLVLNSMNMIVGAVGVAPILGCVSPAYYVFYDKDKNYTLTRYCDYIFKNKRLRGCLFSLGQGIMAIDRGDGRVNTCRLKVSRDDLGRIMLPCPPVEEQHIIISYLDKLCKNIDTIISEKQALIDELENYKKSLIFETVTGKRRVC